MNTFAGALPRALKENSPLCVCLYSEEQFWSSMFTWGNQEEGGSLRNSTLLLWQEEANSPEQHQKS